MGIYSKDLPQLREKVFITDAGLETELWFKKGVELPEFAAYDLLRSESGYSMLFDYYSSFAQLGEQYDKGLVLETPTWRANPDWGEKIGDNREALDGFNRKAVELLKQVRAEHETEQSPVVISGNLGPRGDGYSPDQKMSAGEAEDYHSVQIASLVDAGVDLVTALTINYVEEAIGIVNAARGQDVPVVISFTVETDGNLPTGESLANAIEQVDAATDNGPVYYMVNCAHPTHFGHLFEQGSSLIGRIKGIRCNSSCRSHEELDNSEDLDEGNPEEFGDQCHNLHVLSPDLNILGGCCGTDLRHIEAICRRF